MGVIKGLGAIESHLEEQEKKFEARQGNKGGEDREKATWFKLEDKQSVKVRILQELDEESKNYSEKNGLGFLAVEHQSPKNFRNKAVCTADEGACYACEKHREDFKAGWKQKTRLYVNVLVDDGVNEPYVAILSQGNGPKSVTPALIEQALELGSITDKWFKIKRSGAGQTDTSYLLTPLGDTDGEAGVETFQLWDLDSALRKVPYEDQPKVYHYGEEVQPKPLAEAGATSSSAVW